MAASNQKERAIQFKRFHEGPPILVLPNAWDAASACIFEQAGARAIATTSSGVAAALGYPDGEHISREMMIEAVSRITRVVDCPVTVDNVMISMHVILSTAKDPHAGRARSFAAPRMTCPILVGNIRLWSSLNSSSRLNPLF